MAWNQKYWDILNQIYWTPNYMGLESIDEEKLKRHDQYICIPKQLVNNKNRLYTRTSKYDELKKKLNTYEEILNHVFNLTFAIAGDAVLERLFCTPLGFNDIGPFESIGREIAQRYEWVSENVTQPDGFYLTSNSLIGIEIKLTSTFSSPSQIMKYAALFAWEEQKHKRLFDDIGLLYIIPKTSRAKHWKKCGLDGPEIDESFIEKWLNDLKENSEVRKLYEDCSQTMSSVLNRLKLSVITWSSLRKELLSIERELNCQDVGDQTLLRLLSGFRTQLEEHKKTGIKL